MDELLQKILNVRIMIEGDDKHPNYNRVKTFAEEYEAHMTGEGIEKYLIQYVGRESAAMFKQRCKLTVSINPAIANSLMKPFYKVSRNNNVAKKFDFKNEKINERVTIALNDFNGDKIDNTAGLELWLKTRFIELSFSDPNAFVVIEWDAVGITETIKPRPFEIASGDVLNYEYKGQELQWLFGRSVVNVKHWDGKKITNKDGFRYTYYGIGTSIVFEELDKAYYEKFPPILDPKTQSVIEIKSTKFLITAYDTKLDFVPAFRVGYNRDIKTKGKTFLTPFAPAMPYFKKTLKAVSELDLTMAGHAFPQKLQYVEKCPGASPSESCDKGYCITTNEPCVKCGGSGYNTITSAQEIITLPLPDTKEEMFPLNELLVYKSPPVELIEFQDKYVKGQKQEAHLAVFNSNMFLAYDADFAKTATEIDSNMEGVYDAIEPFTRKYSKVYKLIVYTTAVLCGMDQTSDDFDLIHSFPVDPKLKTIPMLLNDLKAINESGAPSFIRDAVNKDIAEIVFNGDDTELLKFKVKHGFFPFNGKGDEEITMLITTSLVEQRTKILWANFEAIFSDIEKENEDFYLLAPDKQQPIFDAMVDKWVAKITPETPTTIDFTLGTKPGADQNNSGNAGDNGGGEGDDPKGKTTETGGDPNNENAE